MHPHEVEFHFCPVCGGPLVSVRIKKNEPLRLVCSKCRFVFYLDPKVVACTVLELEGKILLLKRGIDPQKYRWVIPGGYVDRGEKVENAAVRETKEECGLTIRIRTLLGVYSYPGKVQVVVVYVGEPISGRLTAGDETLEAKLFRPEEIPWQDLAFQSTSDALKDYCRISETGSL